VSALLPVGCGRSPLAQPQTLERVREVVAKSLGRDISQIDPQKPLGSQGADELDVVEVVMAVEDALKVEVPDSAIGDKPAEAAKTLTVQKLAEIVAEQTEGHKP
jgi:acyl carrier protein